MGVLLGLAAVVLVPTFGVWWLRGSPLAALLALGPAIFASVFITDRLEPQFLSLATQIDGQGQTGTVVLVIAWVVTQGCVLAYLPRICRSRARKPSWVQIVAVQRGRIRSQH